MEVGAGNVFSGAGRGTIAARVTTAQISQYGLAALCRRRVRLCSRMVKARHFHSKPSGATAASKKGVSSPITHRLLVLVLGPRLPSAATMARVREGACYLLKMGVRQSEVYGSQRVRRTFQLYSVYCRWWGEEAARVMLSNLRRIFLSRGRHMLLSAVCFSHFDWEKEKIPKESLQRAVNDLDSVGELVKATVQCEACGKRQVIDQQMANVTYCKCGGSVGYAGNNRQYDSWEPFIERENHIVWRQRHHVHQHLYAYKVYGVYNDVSLAAFLEVQLNSGFRTEWDDSALDLHVLDSQPNSNSDLVYWLVKFPAFFANRDYVFKRRFTYNQAKGEAVIMSQAIDSDDFPEQKGIYRVNEYWSTMVIRAKEDASKPGIEYTITYFDNPGTSLPKSVTNFIAATGFPNFLQKVHRAALSLQMSHQQGRDVYVSLPRQLRYREPDTKEITPTIPEVEVAPIPLQAPVVQAEIDEPTTLELEEKVQVSENSLKSDHKADVVSLAVDYGESVEMPTIQSKQADASDPISVETTVVSDEIFVISLEVPQSPEITDSELPVASIAVEQLSATTSATEGEVMKEDDTEISRGPETEALPEATEEPCAISSTPCTLDTAEERMEKDNETEVKMEKGKEEKTEMSTDTAFDTAPDTALQLSKKKVLVDILEGIEVVAPDMDSKTKLSEKVEQITVSTMDHIEQTLEHNVALKEKLQKIKTKLKSFQERAFQKKMSSIKKMEELERRGHDYNSGLDEKTLKQLENLFYAVNQVLEQDKNMRTGKGYLREYAEDETEQIQNEINESVNFKCDNSPGTPEVYRDEDLEEKGGDMKKHNEEQSKESKPPDDPPDPPTKPPPDTTTPQEEDSFNQTTETGVENLDTIENSYISRCGTADSRAWFSWISTPSIPLWSSVKASNVSPESSQLVSEKESEVRPQTEEYKESDSTTFLTQAWYVVGLGWVFPAKSNSSSDDGDKSSVVQPSQGEGANMKPCDKGIEEPSAWYWSPISGIYKAYTWAFSAAQKENV